MIAYLLGIAGCAVLLLFASKIVYTQIVAIARILHVPPFVISLVLVAFSTSIPELFIGITSAIQGTPEFSLGDVLGSNIVNLTFIAGLIILLGRKQITLPNFISSKFLLFTFAISSAPAFMLWDGTLSRLDGALLLIAYTLYVWTIISDHRETISKETAKAGLGRALSLFAVGIALLIGAAQGIITLATGISDGLHISPFIVGVFAIAFSTSLPELIFGLRAASNRHPELSLADLVGSCAVNATAILGIVALIHPITPVSLSGVLFTGFFGMFVFLAFFLFVGKGRVKPSRGVVLLILYLIFVSFSFIV